MRKKHDAKLRYFRACQATLRNYCVAWFEGGDTYLINLKTDAIRVNIPEDIFNALKHVTYRWSIHLVIAGKSNAQFTKGSVINTLSRYYESDLVDIVASEFEKLENTINTDHLLSKGYIAIPRIEDLTESRIEALLNLIGIWNEN